MDQAPAWLCYEAQIIVETSFDMSLTWHSIPQVGKMTAMVIHRID